MSQTPLAPQSQTQPESPANQPASATAILNALATSARGHVKISAIKAMQPQQGATLIKIETDAGVCGYGPCGEVGPLARAAIAGLEGPRLPHLGLIGKDPLAIQVHYHNIL